MRRSSDSTAETAEVILLVAELIWQIYVDVMWRVENNRPRESNVDGRRVEVISIKTRQARG